MDWPRRARAAGPSVNAAGPAVQHNHMASVHCARLSRERAVVYGPGCEVRPRLFLR